MTDGREFCAAQPCRKYGESQRRGAGRADLRSDNHAVNSNPVTPVRSDHQVLIIAGDAVLAALVGALVESSQLQAAFAKPEERPEEALDRVKPAAALLLEAASSSAQSDVFVRRAKRRGIPVMLFGSAPDVSARKAWAYDHGIPCFALPEQIDAIHTALVHVPALQEGRGIERREVARRADGSVLFEDAEGVRWMVYDRRMMDRRGEAIDREFRNERGEVRRCRVALTDADALSVSVLGAQLARAQRD